jgi:hypothetical protein
MVFSNTLRSHSEWQGLPRGNTQVMGGDVRRGELPTLGRGNHEPNRFESYEEDHGRLAVFGGRGRTVPT